VTHPHRTRIKICGVRDAETARVATEAGADAIGFVFHEQSPRYIEPIDAWTIIRQLPPFVASVGLVVDQSFADFGAIEEQCPTDYMQLHGAEPPELARQCGPRIIKAIQFDESTFANDLTTWNDVDEVDAILVDGSAGGMGSAFDWSKLEAAQATLRKPLILAGGLTVENVGDAIRTIRPFAVDVSSGVERERGVKDHALIHAFCHAVRSTDNDLT